jgi:hypothetical protein
MTCTWSDKQTLQKPNTILELALQLHNAHVICPGKQLDESCLFKGSFAESIKQALPKPYTVVELTAFLVGNSFQFSTLLHYMATCYTWLTPGLYHNRAAKFSCCNKFAD